MRTLPSLFSNLCSAQLLVVQAVMGVSYGWKVKSVFALMDCAHSRATDPLLPRADALLVFDVEFHDLTWKALRSDGNTGYHFVSVKWGAILRSFTGLLFRPGKPSSYFLHLCSR